MNICNSIVYDTVIISDLHLGSPVSIAGDLLRLLKSIKFKRLILLGDILADLNFTRLSKQHWAVLSYLRDLTDPKYKIEVVWVIGNHDEELPPLLGHLIGIEVLDKYEWMIDNKRCIAIHGHQFDPTVLKFAEFTKWISWVFLQIQKIPGLKIRFARWMDHITAHFQNLSNYVEIGAMKYAKLRGFDIICCGHTHKAMQSEKDGIKYFNSGCWVKTTGSYITFLNEDVKVHGIE